jgi:phosphate transport system substrate-binding protein
MVGSSAAYPFAAIVAEEAARRFPLQRGWVVESTGTGAGFQLFCQSRRGGPWMVNASRPMHDSERALCAAHGIEGLMEWKWGMDGLVLAYHDASSGSSWRGVSLTPMDLWRALAADLWDGMQWRPNTTRFWNEIRHDLPAIPIAVYGPPVSSGARDSFLEQLLVPACLQLLDVRHRDRFRDRCHWLREDGAWVDAGDQDNIVIHKIAHQAGSLGIVSFGYWRLHEGLGAVALDSVLPSYETIARQRYRLARPLWMYIRPPVEGERGWLPMLDLLGDRSVALLLEARGLVPLLPGEQASQRLRLRRWREAQ